MKTILRAFLLLAALGAASVGYAQQLQVATGGASGTYSTMFKQLTMVCGNTATLAEKNTSGSSENVDLLVGNQVNAAFVQSDVLYLRARTEDLTNVKTLIALHPEAIHVVVRADAAVKSGGYLGVGGTSTPITQVEQLAGRKIGAYGGSLVTAQVIRLQSEIAYNVVSFENEAGLKDALGKGTVDAGLFVGGAPLGTVASMGDGYRVIGMQPATVKKLEGVYRPGTVNYRKMNSVGVPTVVIDALFVTREYKTDRMVASLSALRACALAKLDDLKETTGTHPAWQTVEAGNKGKWAYYDLPARK